MPTLTEPPSGFDAVVGDPGSSGNNMDYDECVVYDESAMIVSYIIVYEQ
jgi:hypothetical protein